MKAVEKNIYSDASGKAQVIYYKIKHLGHALLVDPGNCPNQGGHLTAFSADKNYWSSYWTAVDFGLIHLAEIQGRKAVGENEQSVSYSIAPSNPNSKFVWNFPKDCKVVENKGSSVVVNWGTRSGNVDVAEYSDTKCKQVYPTLFVSVGGR